MVRAVSAIYGDATVAAGAANPSDIGISDRTGAPIAMWGDSQHSLTLSRSLLSNAFQLVFVSKQLNAQADAAISDATKQAREDAPQKEVARAKKETDDLEAQRQTNLKVFRP
jgi:phage tail sheath protein FI